MMKLRSFQKEVDRVYYGINEYEVEEIKDE